MTETADRPDWLYNEFQFSGVDYADLETARKFDKRHQQFRNYYEDFKRFQERSRLTPNDVVMDLGCGTGALLIHTARFCRKVYGVDPSPSMLAILKEKAESAGLNNIEVETAGFLTFTPPSEPVDAVLASIALHHLPDFWKAVALQRIADVLKPGGVLYLYDVVFTFPIADWRAGTNRVLSDMGASTSDDHTDTEAKKHISSEFSAFDWALEGIFERVGLRIERYYDDASFLRAYVCRKVSDAQASPITLTVEESRQVDALVPKQFGMPTLLLMENAARSCADIFLAEAPKLNFGARPQRVLLCCGKGNNGGDGFALFRRLATLGLDCRVVAFGAREDYAGDAAVNLNVVEKMTVGASEKLVFLDDSAASLQRLRELGQWSDWIVDALLGTGFHGEVRAPYAAVIETINGLNGKPVYSIDVPSGLNADTGETPSLAVKAALTTTLGAVKRGLLAESARPYVGKLFVGDLGFPLVAALNVSRVAAQ